MLPLRFCLRTPVESRPAPGDRNAFSTLSPIRGKTTHLGRSSLSPFSPQVPAVFSAPFPRRLPDWSAAGEGAGTLFPCDVWPESAAFSPCSGDGLPVLGEWRPFRLVRGRWGDPRSCRFPLHPPRKPPRRVLCSGSLDGVLAGPTGRSGAVCSAPAGVRSLSPALCPPGENSGMRQEERAREACGDAAPRGVRAAWARACVSRAAASWPRRGGAGGAQGLSRATPVALAWCRPLDGGPPRGRPPSWQRTSRCGPCRGWATGHGRTDPVACKGLSWVLPASRCGLGCAQRAPHR